VFMERLKALNLGVGSYATGGLLPVRWTPT
jgi:hypothetical protein